MSPTTLPPEIWQLIVELLNDHCFVWSVLRQVSPFHKSITEDVFARHVFRTCSLCFAGQTLRELLPAKMQRIDMMSPTPPAIRFQPYAFIPAHTKARMVLKMRDLASEEAPAPTSRREASKVLSSQQLADIFFKPGPAADATRIRLTHEPHFVRIHNQLKSIRVPSLAIDVTAREISLDWRQLCSVFFRDELKCRFEANSLGAWSSSLGRNYS